MRINIIKSFKTKLFLVVLFGLTLVACTQPSEDPKSVADKYWLLMQSGNTTEAEKLISINSRRVFSKHKNRISSISQLSNSNATTIVTTTVTTINPVNNYSRTETFNTILVLQQGQWKVDINQSHIPPAQSAHEEELQQMAEDLTESLQENIDSIDETMSQGMQVLNEALREGSKEMGDSLLHLMKELNTSMQKSVDKMKQRRQQPLEEQPPEQQTKPDPKKGEGMI